MTLALPEDLHEMMRRYPQVKWAEVARRAFQQELDRLRLFDQLFAGSKMTEETAVKIGRKIRRGAARRAAAARQATAKATRPKRRS